MNDLYRLPESIFNDDNFHTVLTRFDMLILAATYAPELRSGMSRDAVAAALPGITVTRLDNCGHLAHERRVAPEQELLTRSRNKKMLIRPPAGS